jgi:copper ion binding protein
MKTAAALIAASLLAIPLARAAEPAAKPAVEAKAGDATVTIPVGGMTCGGCVNNVGGKLRAVPGVKSVDVNLDAKRAVVTYDAAKATVKALTDAITDAGFEAGTPVQN